MSNQWITHVLQNSPYKGSARMVHVVMADAADSKGEFYPRQEVLAARAAITDRQLRNVIHRMREDGLLTTKRHPRGLVYTLHEVTSDAREVTSGPSAIPEPSSSDRNPSSGRDRNPSSGRDRKSATSDRNPSSDAQTPHLDPSEEPSQEPKTSAPSGLGGNTHRKSSSPEQSSVPGRTPKPGTHAWVVRRFAEEGEKEGCPGFNKGLLDGTLKSLREDPEDPMTYAEIEVLVSVFWIRWGTDVRSQKGNHDPAAMFRHRLPQLREQAHDQIRAMRSGRKSSFERGLELNPRARLMAMSAERKVL